MSKTGKIILAIVAGAILVVVTIWGYKNSGNFGGGSNPLIKQRMNNLKKGR